MKETSRKTLEEIIRVDHAGERGAIKIYEGQLLALKTLKKDEVLKDHLYSLLKFLTARLLGTVLLLLEILI